MKKIIFISILAITACIAEDTYAEHEAKMQQMRERTQTQSGEDRKSVV